MEKAQTEQAQNDTTLSSILTRLAARVTLGFSRQLLINWKFIMRTPTYFLGVLSCL